ncbi:hypothetical protein HPB52_011029 [Rhipicephalus sanguineus]|uniref:Uncharacterized protein n=1 Tax=Rhipicephalus sanguineus TaxID=34632 RepID=A0A9D4PWT1_RHISA|nr:hypothetical protein HPB52_011029 [Rhipicephalus sanguineus]
MATQARQQLLDGAEATFRGPNPNREARRRFLHRASTTAAGGTTAIVVSLIVYFSMHKGLCPQQRPQHAEQKLDGGTRTSEHCAWESDHIGTLLASTASYGTACQDFYAFTCGRDRGYSPLEQSIVRASKHVANSKLRRDRNATETAAVLYASCMSSLASPKVPVRKNARTIPTVLKVRLDNALKKLDTPVAILEAQAFLSREHFPSFLTFWRDPNRVGEHFLDVREPLSTFLDDNAVVEVFLAAADALHVTDAGVKRLAASHLATIDQELKRKWEYSGRVETVSFQDLVDIDARVTEEEWRRFFGAESLEVSYLSSSVKVRGLENVKQALTAFFERMDPIGVAVYSLAHALLPEEMLHVHAGRERASASCLRLVRRAFGNAWYTTMTSEMTPVTTVEAPQKWTSVANDVASVLKKRIVVSSLFTDYADVSTAIAKINNLQTAVTNATNLSPPSVSGLITESLWRSLDPHNLYMNLLAFRRLPNATDYSSYGMNEFDDPRWRSKKDIFGNNGVFTVPEAALTSSFTCEDRFLNYATLGVVVADAMLRAIGGPFCVILGGGDSCLKNSTAAGPLEKVKTCLAAGLDYLESPVHPNGTYGDRSHLLDALVLSTAAFQVALEAGQAALGAKLLSNVSPEMEMRFLTRYCHHLCDQRLGAGSLATGALWARLRCNVAVMNSPMFGPLFKCTQKEQVFPTRCTVL